MNLILGRDLSSLQHFIIPIRVYGNICKFRPIHCITHFQILIQISTLKFISLFKIQGGQTDISQKCEDVKKETM